MPRPRKRNRLLVASLALNAALLIVGGYAVHKRGGLPYALDVLAMKEVDFHRDPFQTTMAKVYEKLPNTPGEIVFLGDSITRQGPWSEIFSNIRNRGVGGNSTRTLLNRLSEVTDSKPDKIFLNVATNDLARGIPLEQTVKDYRQILQRIQTDTPDTRVFVVSLLPVNSTLMNVLGYRNDHIQKINERIKSLADEFGYTYVDLYNPFTDTQGRLRRDLTVEGLHLNTEGYLHYCKLIEHLVAQ